jgi:hypothetical protein
MAGAAGLGSNITWRRELRPSDRPAEELDLDTVDATVRIPFEAHLPRFLLAEEDIPPDGVQNVGCKLPEPQAIALLPHLRCVATTEVVDTNKVIHGRHLDVDGHGPIPGDLGGRVSFGVLELGIGALGKQKQHEIRVIAHRGDVQRGPAFAGRRIEVGTTIEQQLCDLRAASPRGDVQRHPPPPILHRKVRPRVEQQRNHIRTIVVAGPVQRCAAVATDGINWGAGGHQLLEDPPVRPDAGPMQRRITGIVPRRHDLRTVLQQPVNGVGVAPFCGVDDIGYEVLGVAPSMEHQRASHRYPIDRPFRLHSQPPHLS